MLSGNMAPKNNHYDNNNNYYYYYSVSQVGRHPGEAIRDD